MLDGVTVERLAGDSAALDEMAQWVYEQWGGASQGEVRGQLMQYNEELAGLVAMVEGKAIGVLGFRLYQHSRRDEQVMWFNVLYIVEVWRGKGVGRMLHDEGLKQLREHGWGEVFVYSDLPKLYEGFGWAVVEGEDESGHWVLRCGL